MQANHNCEIIMRTLILGSNGMIGHAIYKVLNKSEKVEVFGTYNKTFDQNILSKNNSFIKLSLNCESDLDYFTKIIKRINPNVIINCIGVIKHKQSEYSTKDIIFLNSLLPHILSDISTQLKTRLIHISTDCIFSGKDGGYTEEDVSDTYDIYGKSKSLGEITNNEHLTIRTSTIGHEIIGKHGLLEWFLDQKNECFGYSKAYFSGLTNIELANIIMNNILPNTKLKGLYHVGGNKIDKYTLLKLISKIYNKKIIIKKNNEFILNRSFLSDKFYKDTKYQVKKWESLILDLYANNGTV